MLCFVITNGNLFNLFCVLNHYQLLEIITGLCLMKVWNILHALIQSCLLFRLERAYCPAAWLLTWMLLTKSGQFSMVNHCMHINSAKLCFTHRTHVRVTYLYGMGHNGTGCTLWYRTYLNGMGHTSTLQEIPQWHETYLYGTGQHTSTVRCIPLWYRTTDLHGTVHTSMVQDTSLQYRTYLYGVGHTSTVQEEPPQ